MITTIKTENSKLLLEYEYYDNQRGRYYPQTYSIECLSNDEAIRIRDRLLPQYDDLGLAKNEVYKYTQSNEFYDYHVRELFAAFPNHNEYDNAESVIYINGARILLNVSNNIISYFTDLNIKNRHNNLDAYIIENVLPANHVNAISHTNIIGCVEGQIDIISNGQKIPLANGKYSVGILLYKALLFVKI